MPLPDSQQAGHLSVVEDTTHCAACGRYMPLTLDESRRVHCCDRTQPIGDVPVSIFACPTCGGYGSSPFGCWGTVERPHPHVFMRPVFEMVRELAALSRSGRPPGESRA